MWKENKANPQWKHIIINEFGIPKSFLRESFWDEFVVDFKEVYDRLSFNKASVLAQQPFWFFVSFVGNRAAFNKLTSTLKLNTLKTELNQLTPLHAAAMGGQLRLVQELVEEHGFKITTGDMSQASACHYACYSGDIDTAEYCLGRIDKLTEHRDMLMRSPLDFAIAEDHTNIVSLLLDQHGFQVNEEQIEDASLESNSLFKAMGNLTTPLFSACGSGSVDSIQLLNDLDADWNTTCGPIKTTSAQAAVMFSNTMKRPFFKKYFENEEGIKSFLKASNVLRQLMDESIDYDVLVEQALECKEALFDLLMEKADNHKYTQGLELLEIAANPKIWLGKFFSELKQKILVLEVADKEMINAIKKKVEFRQDVIKGVQKPNKQQISHRDVQSNTSKMILDQVTQSIQNPEFISSSIKMLQLLQQIDPNALSTMFNTIADVTEMGGQNETAGLLRMAGAATPNMNKKDWEKVETFSQTTDGKELFTESLNLGDTDKIIDDFLDAVDEEFQEEEKLTEDELDRILTDALEDENEDEGQEMKTFSFN